MKKILVLLVILVFATLGCDKIIGDNPDYVNVINCTEHADCIYNTENNNYCINDKCVIPDACKENGCVGYSVCVSDTSSDRCIYNYEKDCLNLEGDILECGKDAIGQDIKCYQQGSAGNCIAKIEISDCTTNEDCKNNTDENTLCVNNICRHAVESCFNDEDNCGYNIDGRTHCIMDTETRGYCDYPPCEENGCENSICDGNILKDCSSRETGNCKEFIDTDCESKWDSICNDTGRVPICIEEN